MCVQCAEYLSRLQPTMIRQYIDATMKWFDAMKVKEANEMKWIV